MSHVTAAQQGDLPLVAVITPVYNGAAFLAETMECVQAQTYGNLVHVLLDNASTDQTPEIIETFRNRRVPVTSRRNTETLGLNDNWNATVRLVPKDARYFMLLCADDLMEPETIAKMVALAEKEPSVGVVGCLWTTGVDPKGPVENSRCGLPPDVTVFDGRWFVKSYLMQLHYATSPACQLYRSAVLERRDPFFPFEEFYMDVNACLQTCLDWDYGFLHERLGFTRVHMGRQTDRFYQPKKLFEANWLAFIDRYGPQVMSPAELRKCKSAFLRYYLRRMLLWRFMDRNKPLFDMHVGILKEHAARPTIAGYIVALADWAWLAIQNRRNEVSKDPSLWPKVWAELDVNPSSRPAPRG